MNNGITIVIPAYREEGNIEAAIDNVVMVASRVTQDYEVIVIDDGSPDKTGDFARLRAEANPNIRVATRAASALGEALRYPAGLFNLEIEKSLIKEWTDLFCATLERVEVSRFFVRCASLPAAIENANPFEGQGAHRRLV